MKITLNGNIIDTQQDTLAALLTEQGFSNDIVASAMNGDFIPIAQRADTALVENCHIDIVAPMQGG